MAGFKYIEKTVSGEVVGGVFVEGISIDKEKAIKLAKKLDAFANAVEIGFMSPLAFIDLNFTQFIGDELEEAEAFKTLIEAFKKHPSLTSIELRVCFLSTNALNTLTEELPNFSSLTSIDLEANKLTDEGAKNLAEKLKSNCSLTFLNLGGNKITDDGAKTLVEALKNHHSLTFLGLRSNKIKNKEALSESTNHSSLKVDFKRYKPLK